MELRIRACLVAFKQVRIAPAEQASSGRQALCGRGRRGSAVQEHDDSPEGAMVRGVVWGKHFYSDDRPESQNHDLACRWRTGPSAAGQSRDERPCYPHRTDTQQPPEWFCWGGDINSASLDSAHARRLWGKCLRKPSNQGDVLTCGKLCENPQSRILASGVHNIVLANGLLRSGEKSD